MTAKHPVNPRAPHNVSRFSYKDRQFKVDDQLEQTVFHYSDDGYARVRHVVAPEQGVTCFVAPKVIKIEF